MLTTETHSSALKLSKSAADYHSDFQILSFHTPSVGNGDTSQLAAMVRCLADNGTRLGVNLRGVYLRVRPRMEVMLSPDEQLDRSIQAMIHNVPPHSGQVSMSIAKTRWRRCIQLMGAGGWSALMRLGRYGTMRLRCLKLGAKTP